MAVNDTAGIVSHRFRFPHPVVRQVPLVADHEDQVRVLGQN